MDRKPEEEAIPDATTLVGLDVYSQDNQFIGRVSEYLPTAPESELGIQRGHFDPVDADGRLRDARHIMVDGTGTIIQSMLIVPVRSLEIDLRGRRVTLPLTVAQIEAMPHHDPNLGDSELPT